MPSPQQRLDIDRLLKTIDAPAAMIILAAPDGSVESVVSGGLVDPNTPGRVLMGSELAFTLSYFVLAEYTEELFGNMSAAQQRAARVITLPTREDAERLGLFNPRGH